MTIVRWGEREERRGAAAKRRSMERLSIRLIDEAAEFLRGRVRRTPLEESPGLTEILGAKTWLKLECLQLTGSFKIRGAFFQLSRLAESEREAGVVTCSAGNHGKAVALAARELGIVATVYVPSTVDKVKLEGIRSMGARAIVSEFPGYDATEEFARVEAKRTRQPFISAFDDGAVMAGNGGTLGREIVEDCPEARTVIFPVGGGGLGAGLAWEWKEKWPKANLIAVQHEGSPALKMSLDRGKAVTRLPFVETLAAGVEGGIGEAPFEILKTRVDEVALVSEAEILRAVRELAAQHQYMTEATGAVAAAACYAGKLGKLREPAVVVLTGRNVSLGVYQRILERAGGEGLEEKR
jgi:threonine dehydratase